MNSLLLALISFGDSLIAVGIMVAGSAFLAATRNLKAAAILFLALVAAGGTIGALKVVFIGCDLYVRDFDIRFPSGHAALSASALGTICALIASRLIGWRRLAVLVGFLVVEAGIATTLVMMGFHTFYEVVVGLVIGGCAAVAAYVTARTVQITPIRWRGLALTVAAVVILVNVARIPSHDLAGWIAAEAQPQTSVCRRAPTAQLQPMDIGPDVHVASEVLSDQNPAGTAMPVDAIASED